VIEGEALDEIIDALITEHQASLLAAQDQPQAGARP
jgi:protein subunit release factor A